MVLELLASLHEHRRDNDPFHLPGNRGALRALANP
jgi:hypothetical protein